MTILIVIFVHYAPKNRTGLTADVSKSKPNKESFQKVQPLRCGVLNAEVNAVERTPSFVAVHKVMSSALRSPVPHSHGTENTNINVNSVAATSRIAAKT